MNISNPDSTSIHDQQDLGTRRREPPWWDHQRHPLIALRRCIEEMLPQSPDRSSRQRVFDLGCGDRPYEPVVRSHGFGYVGCDLDPRAEVHITPGRRLEVADGDAAGIVSFQVLEHVWDLEWYFGECRRLLSPGGWLLLSTHGVWPYHPHPTDFRRWTHSGLKAELEVHGFDVISMRGLLGPLAWSTQVRALGFRHVMRQIPLVRALAPLMCLAMNLRIAVEEFVTPEAIRFENASIYVVLCKSRVGGA